MYSKSITVLFLKVTGRIMAFMKITKKMTMKKISVITQFCLQRQRAKQLAYYEHDQNCRHLRYTRSTLVSDISQTEKRPKRKNTRIQVK